MSAADDAVAERLINRVETAERLNEIATAQIERLVTLRERAEELAASRLRYIERLESWFPDGIPDGYGPDFDGPHTP